jgi:hypothetical protein
LLPWWKAKHLSLALQPELEDSFCDFGTLVDILGSTFQHHATKLLKPMLQKCVSLGMTHSLASRLVVPKFRHVSAGAFHGRLQQGKDFLTLQRT